MRPPLPSPCDTRKLIAFTQHLFVANAPSIHPECSPRKLINMGGDWVVLSHISLPDGRIERQIDVKGVESR